MLRTAVEEAFRRVSAVSGNLARLAYLASLQQQPGVYSHWGLAADYGEKALCDAFGHAHRMVLENMLQTDLAELEGELAMHAEDTFESKTQSLRNLLGRPGLAPRNAGKHVNAHLKYVFASLQALARHSG